jgi:membrane protein implicated in regulation of membrane protease activity
MIIMLACVAALLYFPRLRHAVGEFVFGALAFVALVLVFGEVGVFIGLGLALASIYRRWRPRRGQRKRPRRVIGVSCRATAPVGSLKLSR